ncbi:hypothetical protein CGCSCA4_v014572 [Colletotrichum siamense]|uniref:Uncharacterized protein n=1 Tax=Colletotrichum siamense TaxID=690259 RepID=A0A9P5ED23_COLSI|nr:hypothetical protein CGCSCA4_v014572 [Colletotrichum siamense]KAF4842801.1 hypothetical protein CGCSCA2_v014508 [Colletotrichum siamense]
MCLGNSDQFVCGVRVEWYRDQGRSRGVSWCVRSRAYILHAIVAAQCLPHHVDHPDFEERFLPDVRIACNMTHGGDFARLIRPHFDRLVKHYAKKWVTANGPVVLKDTVVINGNGTEEYRFNQELVDRCFNDVDAIERWLRVDLGKQDWWDKDPGATSHPSTPVAPPNHRTPTTPATPTTPVTQSRRRSGTASSTSTGRSRRPPQTPTHPKRGPSAADMDRLASSVKALTFPSDSGAGQTPSTPTRSPPGPPLSGLFSAPASGLAGERRGPMPAAASPVPAKDGTPGLGPALWGPTPTAGVPNLEPSPVMFPPTPARSLASARAPSTAPPSSEGWAFPSSSSSSSPAPRGPPAPSTIATTRSRSAAPSTFVSSVAPPSFVPSSFSPSAAQRHPPPPTTILTDGTRSVAGAAPSTLVSSIAPLPSIHSSLPRRFRESVRPPPPPTTILTDGATDALSVLEAPVVEHAHYGNGHGDGGSGGHGGYGMGVENGVETWEDRIRESFEATHLAWRYVVEVETAAKALMFGIDGTV